MDAIDLTNDSEEASLSSKKRDINETNSATPSILARIRALEEELAVPTKKQAVEQLSNANASIAAKVNLAAVSMPAPKPVVNPVAVAPHAAKKAELKPTKVLKKDSPHALLWICSHGKGQGRHWKSSALKLIGVYATKEAAEKKKEEVMMQYDRCGHGDICVGGTWEDEIDLVIRPCGELML